MISLICFILTLLGSINWFCIGVLQYDFVAGIFGSQANIFSRIIYALIGISSIWLVFALIKGKGKIKIDGKTSTDKALIAKKKKALSTEASDEYNHFNGINNDLYNNYNHRSNTNQNHYDSYNNNHNHYKNNYERPSSNFDDFDDYR